MWVRTPDNTIGFLLDSDGRYWNGVTFDSLKKKEPNQAARVRIPSGRIKQFCLADLRFDSEASSRRHLKGQA